MNESHLEGLLYRRCFDFGKRQDIGIVLEIGTFRDIDSSELDEVCLTVIRDGIVEMKSYAGNEIEHVQVSPVPVKLQDITFNASVMYETWHEMETNLHPSVAGNYYRKLRKYILKTEAILRANGLMNDFNQTFMMTCLASISFY